MSLSAEFDGSDISRVIFNEPVTLARAIQFLWGRQRVDPPTLGPALTPDPAEATHGPLHRRFIIRNDASLYNELEPPNLTRAYINRGGPRVVMGAPVSVSDFPDWLSEEVRHRIINHSLHDGVTRFHGPRPWGDIVVWQHTTGPFRDVQYYLEFPESVDFYINIGAGDRATARLLQHVYSLWNHDLSYFVEQRRMSPTDARHELIRINDGIFREVLKGALAMLGFVGAINAAVSIMRTYARQMVQMAESLQLRMRTPTLPPRQRLVPLTRDIRERMPTTPQDHVYMGRGGGREDYLREWHDHGGVGEPPEHGFQVVDQHGRVVRRIGYRSPEEPLVPVPEPAAAPPTSTLTGSHGTLLEEVAERSRIREMLQVLAYQQTTATRLVRVIGGRLDPEYLRQWLAAGGTGSPPSQGFVVWSATLDEVLKVVIPSNR